MLIMVQAIKKSRTADNLDIPDIADKTSWSS